MLLTNGSELGYYAGGEQSGWHDVGSYSAGWQIAGWQIAGWQIAGCADFDGNGKSDVLFSNSSDNLIGYYADGQPANWKSLGSYTAGWQIVMA